MVISKYSDYAGKKINKWEIISFVERVKSWDWWICKCECGTEKKIRLEHVIKGKSKQCIRCAKHKHDFAHRGMDRKSSGYYAWAGMIQRCTNPNHEKYPVYGAVGITVCDRWRDFRNFLEDMGPKPSLKHTIERIDGTKGYYKENCLWATAVAQARNRPGYNRVLTLNGKSMIMSDWSKELGIPMGTLSNRIHLLGWSEEKALSTVGNPRSYKVQYKGQTMALCDLQRLTGVNYATIKYRMNKLGMTAEEAVNTVKYDCGGRSKS